MESPAEPLLLDARDLERRFGPVRVLRGVSLRVAAGECHLVVGPNGAGKSTLLRLLAGLARPSAGRVLLGGISLREAAEVRRRIGLLSHQSHLYDDLTAVENLKFTALLYGLSDGERTARSRLHAVGLGEHCDEPVRRLSRGMVQRVAIARALLHQPALLLLDEPFTGLDPQSIEQVAALLEGERAGGRGLVLVSHDVHESWELATHVHLLVQGAWRITGLRAGSLDGFLGRYREALHG